jgi:hypothetical protein
MSANQGQLIELLGLLQIGHCPKQSSCSSADQGGGSGVRAQSLVTPAHKMGLYSKPPLAVGCVCFIIVLTPNSPPPPTAGIFFQPFSVRIGPDRWRNSSGEIRRASFLVSSLAADRWPSSSS